MQKGDWPARQQLQDDNQAHAANGYLHSAILHDVNSEAHGINNEGTLTAMGKKQRRLISQRQLL